MGATATSGRDSVASRIPVAGMARSYKDIASRNVGGVTPTYTPTHATSRAHPVL